MQASGRAKAGMMLRAGGCAAFLAVLYPVLAGGWTGTAFICVAILLPPLFLFQVRLGSSRTEALALRWSWIRHLGPVLMSLLIESGRVACALLRVRPGRPAGRTTTERFEPEGRDDAQRRGHRAAAEMIGSASPNGIILSIAGDERSCDVHRLLPSRTPGPAGWPA